MVTDSTLNLQPSQDWKYLGRLVGGLKIEPAKAASRILFFEVWHLDKRRGGFLLVDGLELHTELEIRGKLALEAFRLLCDELRRRGLVRIVTYVERDNRKAAIGAAVAGFSRAAVVGSKTYFEKCLI